MSVKNITPDLVNEILVNDAAVYIDVRTEQEFIGGHVPRSLNIPVAWPNPTTGQMKPNPDFVKVVSAHFAKETPLILGCQTGGRSKFAAELLVKEGFQNVSNMKGGFGGHRDILGRLIEPGWSQFALQVETEVHPNQSYASLGNPSGNPLGSEHRIKRKKSGKLSRTGKCRSERGNLDSG